MSIGLAQEATAADPPEASVLRTYVAPLGWHTRYMLRAYAQHVFVVALALVTLALSIDLSPQMPKLLAADKGAGTIATVLHVAWFAALRTADLLPRFLAFAAFLGVLWVELSHTLSRERVVIWNTGRSPAQCLTPILLLGLILGVVQSGCDFYLRPAAMAWQISHHLGAYGERYSRELTKTAVWLTAGNDLVSARVEYGPPAVLHDVAIYRLNSEGHIVEVDNAKAAVPTASGRTWLLREGNAWSAGAPSEAGATASTLADASLASSFARREIDLKLDPLWLSTFGMSPIFLPEGTLEAIANSTHGSHFTGNFQTWVQARYGHALLPGLMALLASSMSLLLLAYRIRSEALLAIVLAGYVADLATRVFLLLGEQGYVRPAIAGWLVPVMLCVAAASLLGASEMRRIARTRV